MSDDFEEVFDPETASLIGDPDALDPNQSYYGRAAHLDWTMASARRIPIDPRVQFSIDLGAGSGAPHSNIDPATSTSPALNGATPAIEGLQAQLPDQHIADIMRGIDAIRGAGDIELASVIRNAVFELGLVNGFGHQQSHLSESFFTPGQFADGTFGGSPIHGDPLGLVSQNSDQPRSFGGAGTPGPHRNPGSSSGGSDWDALWGWLLGGSSEPSAGVEHPDGGTAGDYGPGDPSGRQGYPPNTVGGQRDPATQDQPPGTPPPAPPSGSTGPIPPPFPSTPAPSSPSGGGTPIWISNTNTKPEKPDKPGKPEKLPGDDGGPTDLMGLAGQLLPSYLAEQGARHPRWFTGPGAYLGPDGHGWGGGGGQPVTGPGGLADEPNRAATAASVANVIRAVHRIRQGIGPGRDPRRSANLQNLAVAALASLSKAR